MLPKYIIIIVLLICGIVGVILFGIFLFTTAVFQSFLLPIVCILAVALIFFIFRFFNKKDDYLE